MTAPKDNSISVKEYNEIREYKNLEIESEKMLHFKTTTVPVTERALSMTKKGTDNQIMKIPAVATNMNY